MTGKIGSYSLGILGSQTGSFGALEIGQESASKEEALYSTVRLKKDILERSSVGLIFADKSTSAGKRAMVEREDSTQTCSFLKPIGYRDNMR